MMDRTQSAKEQLDTSLSTLMIMVVMILSLLINRLKHTHLDTDDVHLTPQTALPTAPPCRATRSARHVLFPQYLSPHVS